MTVSISKYKLSKQQHTIALDNTLGKNENPFTDLYAYDFQPFFRIGMRFVKHEMVWFLSNQAHLITSATQASFNTEMSVFLPFSIFQLSESLPFLYTVTPNRYPFRAEPPHINSPLRRVPPPPPRGGGTNPCLQIHTLQIHLF